MTERHALAQLIDSVEEANRWSDTDVVKRAGARGHSLSKQTISRYRIENPLVSIKGAVILALADGLGVTPTQIATAALSSMNVPLHLTGDTDAEVAIRRDVSLSDEARGMLLALVRQYRDNRKVDHEDTSTQSTTTLTAVGSEAGPRPTKNRAGNAGTPTVKPDEISRRLPHRLNGDETPPPT